jgi:aminotransferase
VSHIGPEGQTVRGPAVASALQAKAARLPDLIRLSRGDSDFATPPHIVAAVHRHLSGLSHDAILPAAGSAELRRAIADRVRRVNHLDVDPKTEVVVTEGAQEAAFLMILAAVGPGDEVIIPEPNYYSYPDAVRMAGGVPVGVHCPVDRDYAIDPDAVRRAITAHTTALLLVSPNNPSANVITPETVRVLAGIAEEHDLLVLADDTYDRFLYDDAAHTSPGALPEARARTLTINTCSKTYAMTGWRVGWVCGPADLMARVRKLKEATTGGTSSLGQEAALAALTGPQDVVDVMRAAFARRRADTLAALDAMGLPYGRPAGGQFVFVDIRSLEIPSVACADRLLEAAHVLVGPGLVFGPAWDGFLRIAWLVPDDELREGLRRMAEVVGAL